MELIQVFDWLKMPQDISDDLAVYFEASNGSYHRWYPDDNWKYPGERLKTKVNKWLLKNGMLVDTNNKYFYVLIYISW
jgi:hypothetical protein